MATKQHISTVLSDLLPENRRREDGRHRRVIRSFLDRTTISRDLSRALEDDRTFGQRIADRVAAFGGSWTFIFIFSVILLTWVVLNSVLLVRDNLDFDPFPYILLNLFLSMLAAVQAPVILMSQNRQAAKDRLAAEHDYEVNLKAELEVRLLHEKLDEIREQKWKDLVEMQQNQIKMLQQLLESEKVMRK